MAKEIIEWRFNSVGARPNNYHAMDEMRQIVLVLFQLRDKNMCAGRFYIGDSYLPWRSLQGTWFSNTEVIAWADMPKGGNW